MIQFEVAKFGYRIRAKSGAVVDHVLIHGRDAGEAERKLRQMYPDCQVLGAWNETARLRPAGSTFEEIVDLITPPKTVG